MNLKEPLLPNRTIFETTLKIFHKESSGTCFIINHNSKQYLISAKHIFPNSINKDIVDIKVTGASINRTLKAKILFHNIDIVDIAVLEIEQIHFGEVLSLKTSSSFHIGQECIFLGFPLYDFLRSSTSIGDVALVKKAIVSGRLSKDKVITILLDGHNNPGFSGGPIITHNGLVSEQFLIGVISGYYLQGNSNKVLIEEKEIEILTNTNSGIIITYPSEYIIEIIDNS
ncbi:S1 family peptidase [Aquirufa sp. Wall-65K1]